MAKRLISSISIESVKSNGVTLLTKAQSLAQPIFFATRVALELGKQVAQHQRLLSIGSFIEAQAGIGRFFTCIQTGAWRKVTVSEATYLASQLVTVAGFFYVGEMIGRKSLIGYKVGATGGHGHH